MEVHLPRIASPNVGCPVTVSLEDLGNQGMDVVTAEKGNPHPKRSFRQLSDRLGYSKRRGIYFGTSGKEGVGRRRRE
jgi:hypothetical protein